MSLPALEPLWLLVGGHKFVLMPTVEPVCGELGGQRSWTVHCSGSIFKVIKYEQGVGARREGVGGFHYRLCGGFADAVDTLSKWIAPLIPAIEAAA